MAVKFEVLWEVWRITERRDGAIYKTAYVEDRWVRVDTFNRLSRPDDDPDLLWVPKSGTDTHRTVIVPDQE